MEVALFGALALFLAPGGVVYGVWSGEAAGTVLLILTGGFAAIVASYLAFQDRLDRTAAASVPGGEDGAEEPFLPHASIWPFEMGVGLATTLTGVVLGWAILIPGALLLLHSVAGWIGQSRRRSSR